MDFHLFNSPYEFINKKLSQIDKQLMSKCHWCRLRQKGYFNWALWLIIFFYFGKRLNNISCSFEKGILLVQNKWNSFHKITVICGVKIWQSEITQCKILSIIKFLKLFQFRLNFFKNLRNTLLVFLIPEKIGNGTPHICKNTKKWLNSGLFFDIFAQKFLLFRSQNNILIDCSGFSQFEVTIDEIWQIDKRNIQRQFIFFMPLAVFSVKFILPNCTSIRE